MKTESQAREQAQERADWLREPIVVFRDTWHTPNDFGFCCKVSWDRVLPNKNLQLVATVQPCENAT